MTAINPPTRPRDESVCFERHVSGVGRFGLRPLRVPDDIPRLHGWLTRDYARFWNMRHMSQAEVETFYRDLMRSGHARAYQGLHEGRPAFLMESYDPRHDPVGEHYDARPGDRGMHFLAAPNERPIPGFTLAVMRTIMEHLFDDPSIDRVVVEPDVRNAKIHVLNRRVGFRRDRVVVLADKTADLAFCTRDRYTAALVGETRP